MKKRVVITGLGVVAPNGVGKEAFWQALTQGLSGVRSIRRFDPQGMTTRIAGEIDSFQPEQFVEPTEIKKMDRSHVYAMAAGLLALEDSHLELEKENLERFGSSIGNAIGGVDFVRKEIDVLRDKGPRRTSPYTAIAYFPCGTNGLLSIRLGLKGVVLTLCNGNASGTDALGMGFRTVQSGRADVMFAGGTEAPLIPLFIGGFEKDGVLSRCDTPALGARPFDESADGMVLGEGSSVLVLESLDHAQARGATIYAEVLGYASGNTPFDVSRPEMSSTGMQATLQRGIAEAGISAADVDVIHGQGLSLFDHDSIESRSFGEAFSNHGSAAPVTAVSSWIGNSLGAMGGFQAAASALMIDQRIVPAVANFRAGCKPCPVSIVKETFSPKRLDVVVQNSYCFNGKNSMLVLRRFHG